MEKLQSKAFKETMMRESMGGNAGPGRLAVNALVDRETGEVIKFGNVQDYDKADRENLQYGEATFIYDMGKWELRDGKVATVAKEHFVDVIPRKNLSEAAITNLKEAVQRIKSQSLEEREEDTETRAT